MTASTAARVDSSRPGQIWAISCGNDAFETFRPISPQLSHLPLCWPRSAVSARRKRSGRQNDIGDGPLPPGSGGVGLPPDPGGVGRQRSAHWAPSHQRSVVVPGTVYQPGGAGRGAPVGSGVGGVARTGLGAAGATSRSGNLSITFAVSAVTIWGSAGLLIKDPSSAESTRSTHCTACTLPASGSGLESSVNKFPATCPITRAMGSGMPAWTAAI
jgi:hypothetical protein